MEKRYTTSHEWVYRKDKKIAVVGLCDDFLAEIDEIVAFDFFALNQDVKKGEAVCILESTKAAIEVYAPLSGTVVAVNDNFLKDKSWLFKLKIKNLDEWNQLFDLEAYLEYCQT